MMTSFEHVAAVCEAQRITINPEVVDWAATLPADIDDIYGTTCFTPTPLYAAVAGAYAELRRSPGVALYRGAGPIVPDEIIANDNVAAHFVRVVNASRQPETNPVPELNRSFTGVRNVDTCSSAEVNFACTFARMEDPNAKVGAFSSDMLGYQLLVDGAMRAVAVRKSVGQPGTLLLEDMTINGIPCAKGLLLRAELPGDVFTDKKPNPVPSDQQTWLPIANVSLAAGIRLSGFGVDPMRRYADFPGLSRSAFEASKYILGYTIDDLAKIANTALQRIPALTY